MDTPDTSGAFLDDLHQALKHLYDAAYLRASPLVRTFRLSERPNPAAELRELLERGIEALGGTSGSPPAPTASRRYEVLYYSYVRQFRQRDVGLQLGISSRQVRREIEQALEDLATCLSGLSKNRTAPDSSRSAQAMPAKELEGARMDREMTWLATSLIDRTTDPVPIIREAVRLARIVSDRHGAVLSVSLGEPLPLIAAAETVLKQMVLNSLTAALQAAPGGHITLHVQGTDREVEIGVEASPVCGTPPDPSLVEGLEMVSRLAQLYQGQVATGWECQGLHIMVRLPASRQVTVLAIEDNLDTFQLWERYLQNTRFRLMSERDSQRAVARATELHPDLIVLDVMMPGIDGWEVLGRLRHHPATSAIPVIVCTVLPQEELALALGASGFIRKPVAREDLRAALERQIAAAAHG